jgi:multicomponent Na+:H+ antiporter subunit G
MKDLLVIALLLSGAFFMLVAAVGILRMPDIYMRMSCNAKAVTIGLGLLLLGLALYFGEIGVGTRALATIGFIGLTIPVASHLLGRASYLSGLPLWHGTIRDEWRDRNQP